MASGIRAGSIRPVNLNLSASDAACIWFCICFVKLPSPTKSQIQFSNFAASWLAESIMNSCPLRANSRAIVTGPSAAARIEHESGWNNTFDVLAEMLAGA